MKSRAEKELPEGRVVRKPAEAPKPLNRRVRRAGRRQAKHDPTMGPWLAAHRRAFGGILTMRQAVEMNAATRRKEQAAAAEAGRTDA